MQLVRPRGVAALLAVAVTAGAGGWASPAAAAGVAPTGSYILNTTSIYAAQSVLLTQTSLADDTDPVDAITRVVDWGDGTSQTVPAGTTKLRHAYAKTGSFTVTVQLTDAEGNTAPGSLARAAVTVAATPGTFKLDRTTGYVWVDPTATAPAETQGWSKLTVSLSAIPANVSRVRLTWATVDTAWCPGPRKRRSGITSGAPTRSPRRWRAATGCRRRRQSAR